MHLSVGQSFLLLSSSLHAHTCTCTHARTHMYTHARTYTHTYTHARTRVHTHTHTHTHTHQPFPPFIPGQLPIPLSQKSPFVVPNLSSSTAPTISTIMRPSLGTAAEDKNQSPVASSTPQTESGVASKTQTGGGNVTPGLWTWEMFQSYVERMELHVATDSGPVVVLHIHVYMYIHRYCIVHTLLTPVVLPSTGFMSVPASVPPSCSSNHSASCQ